ncbi:hypothetical protein CPC08DRAFT_729969 [Agrocybe pediades]|nr:hypothetical protein CPC08DRAFT_729969 [Agrocybe pediades]
MPPKANTNFVPIISTRHKNKQKHPGKIVDETEQKRRNPAKVRRAREEEASRREAEDQRESESLAVVAEIEDEGPQLARRLIFSSRRLSQVLTTWQAIHLKKSGTHSHATMIAIGRAEFVDPVSSGSSDKKKPGRDDISVLRRTIADNLPLTSIVPPLAQLFPSNSSGGGKRTASSVGTEVSASSKKAKRDATAASLTPGFPCSHAFKFVGEHQQFKQRLLVREGDGFIPDDEDDVEGRSVATMSKASKKKFISMRMSKKLQRGGKNKWTLGHLPPGTKDVFTDTLVPIAKLKAGTGDPWMGLSFTHKSKVWWALYSKMRHIKWTTVMPGWTWVAYRLSNWRNAFAPHAAIAVRTLVEANSSMLDDGAKDKVRDLIDFYLTKRGTPPLAPFLFKAWEEDEDTAQESNKSWHVQQGRFQSDLVVYTLAHAHFTECNPIPDPDELYDDSLPCGALALAVQAAEQALKFWVTGEYVPNTAAKLCAEAYGDKIARKNASGKLVDIKVLVSELYFPAANVLPRSQRQEIFEEAAEVVEARRRRKKCRSMSLSSRASSEIPMEVETTPLINDHPV